MKQAIYSSRTADKFVVRLPDGMRERIAEVARNHHRSMNSEIIARLEQSLIQEGALGDELSMRLDSPNCPCMNANCCNASANCRIASRTRWWPSSLTMWKWLPTPPEVCRRT